jgi:methionyl-tRNA formyltransferase
MLIGNGPTAFTALQSLTERFTVSGLCREPGHADAADEVVRFAQTAQIPIFTDTSPPGIHRAIGLSRPDGVVVSSYNRILTGEILESCHFINVHYAPLPRYRGRACVNWAVINGEPFAAISIHELVPALDAGNLLFQQLVPIDESDTISTLYERLNELQRIHLGKTVEQYFGGFRGTPQLQADASYGCTRLPDDGRIAWESPTRAVDRLVKALTEPFPGAYTYLHGRRLIVWRAEIVIDAPRYDGRIPGRVIAIDRTTGSVDVLTSDGIVRLLEVELDEGTRIKPASVIRSVRTTLGLSSEHLLARIEQLERQLRTLSASPAPSSAGESTDIPAAR